jgi:hypothetical protein
MSALSRALDHWQAGHPIPRNIALELIEDGHDVASLQRFHLKASRPHGDRTKEPAEDQ